jgi:hypothetical protein
LAAIGSDQGGADEVRSPFAYEVRRGRPFARLVRAIAVAVGAATVIAGCGASGDATVATVQGRAIKKSMLSHWTNIKRVELKGSSRSSKERRPERAALAFLITAEWLEAESAVQGVRVPDAEVKMTYRHLLEGPSGGLFASSLRRRGLSEGDELLLLRLGALATRLRSKIGASRRTPLPAAALRRIGAFQIAYRERWKQRTSCRPGYVIAECREGPRLPDGGSPGA